MMKITLAVVAAALVLMMVSHVRPVQAEGAKTAQRMAQVDVQIGRDRDDRYDRYDRDRDSGSTVGIGPGGVTVGPRQRCRTVTTRVERDDGRSIMRKERRCD